MTRTLVFVLLITCSGLGLAQDCALPKPKGNLATYSQLLSIQRLDGCFGGENDDSEIAGSIRKSKDAVGKLEEEVLTAEDYAALRNQAAQALMELAKSLKREEDSATDEWKQRIRLVAARLESAASQTALPDNQIFNAEEWKPDSGLAVLDGELRVGEPVDEDCKAGYTDACKSAQRSAGAILRHSLLANDMLGEVVRVARIVPKYRDLKVLDDKWTYYFEHGHSQYPWELFVNQAIFSRSNDCSKSDDDAGRSSIGSNANCFASPPNGQIILFHLDAAPEYAGSRNDEGSEFNAVALVEVIGYKWLKYAGDGSSGRTYGGSLIATVSPESSGKRVGWGAMVHLTEKFSVGIARRDLGRDGDETTWLVSADLGKLLDMTSLQERLDFRKLARTNP